MRWRVAALVLCCCAMALPPAASAQTSPRERVLMDFGWRFQNGDPAEVGKTLDYPEADDRQFKGDTLLSRG